MPKAAAVIFDFGGVLLDWNPERVYRPHFRDERAMQRFFDETKILLHNRELDRGKPFDHVLRELTERHPQHREALWLWKNAWARMLGGPIEGSITLLRELHSDGVPLYGLTNWAAETFPFVFYTYDFFLLFQDIVVSGRENLIKPEPEIFHLCLNRNGLAAQDTLFIDDNAENVAVARHLGMQAIHFQSPEHLRAELKQLGFGVQS